MLIFKQESLEQRAAAGTALPLVFRQMAESGGLDDGAIAAHATLFPRWEEGARYEKGSLRRCSLCGDVFRCIDPPTGGRARGSQPPSKSPRSWQRVGADVCDTKKPIEAEPE